MGTGVVVKCQCGYQKTFTFGIGFLYPQVYNSVVEKIQDGCYGELCKKFLAKHPNGKVNCSKIALMCPDCGNIENGIDLTMYVPDGKKENYKLYAKHDHKCPVCGSIMYILDEDDFVAKLHEHQIRCPECGGSLEFADYMNWD